MQASILLYATEGPLELAGDHPDVDPHEATFRVELQSTNDALVGQLLLEPRPNEEIAVLASF